MWAAVRTGSRAWLAARLGAHKRAQAEGRQVRLAVAGRQVRRIIALTALDRLIPVYSSLDQALAHRAAPQQRAAPDVVAGHPADEEGLPLQPDTEP